MIPPARSPGRPRATRTAVWLALIALVGGCTSTTVSDATEAETAVESTDGSDAPTPRVPAFGTDADGLDATVVALTPDAAARDGTARVDARVAADDQSRSRGLMDVEDLPDGAGMLFVYPEERAGAFWMKDTLVALDIAFIAADGTVRAVLTMEPCTAEPCPIYDPQVDYLAALEVPAGWFATNGIDVGAEASWSAPEPADPVRQ